MDQDDGAHPALRKFAVEFRTILIEIIRENEQSGASEGASTATLLS
jgi:hypothetical protein